MSEALDNQDEWSADELIPFGKYMLLDRLSSGATASVYRANVRGEAGFERVVAIKRILPHMSGDPAFVKTFVAEAKTTARLTHANICPIYELGKVGESLYMAVEYVAGKDLGRVEQLLRSKNQIMAPSTAAWIAARLCDALEYAHNLKNMAGDRIGIVHRDLSPTNIVISYEGQVKLIDFGLAKAVGKSQQTNVDALKKKLSYMSPEMVKGRAPDARSDIFGVGICLYEMLTGRKLFAGKNDIDTLKQVGMASVPPPSAVMDDAPEELEMILMRALERDPADRWQSAAEMGEALDTYLQQTARGFGINQLSSWMYELFGSEIETEQASFRRLVLASNDPQVVRQRRFFFSSPDGAAARARAEVEKRLSSVAPQGVFTTTPRIEPARIPAEARPVEGMAPVRFEDEATGFYEAPGDDEPTAFYDEAGASTGRPGGFEDEPTAFIDGRSAPAGEPFADEPTQALGEGDLVLLGGGVVADPFDFEEEATEIFFNKEDGIGVPNLLEEINDVQETSGPLNRPIVSPELQMPAPAPAAAPPRSSMPPQVLPSTPPITPPPGASPSSIAPASEFIGTPRRSSAVPALAAAVVLLGLIGVLVARTPVGIALGLRAAAVGSLEIRTNPSTSASIKIDGIYRGQAPVRVDGIAIGAHSLEALAQGYKPGSGQVAVKGGTVSRVELSLAPEPQPEPEPEPAVDQGAGATATGATTEGAGTGTETSTTRAATTTDSTTRRRRKFGPRSGAGDEADEPAADAAGELVVSSVPWAQVFLDGQDTGRQTPLLGFAVPPGPHELGLRTADGRTHARKIYVQPGKITRIVQRF